MLPISYNTSCSICRKSDGIRHMYYVRDVIEDEYKNKTEYEVMRQVEDWRIEDKHVCKFCGSSFIEVYNIIAGSHTLYDFVRLVSECKSKQEEMFILSIKKTNHENKIEIGGSASPSSIFLLSCFKQIKNTLSERQDESFINQSNGFFLICFTGKTSYETSSSNIKLQRFCSQGFDKNELFSISSTTLNNMEMLDENDIF